MGEKTTGTPSEKHLEISPEILDSETTMLNNLES